MFDQAAVGFVESHRTVAEYPAVCTAQIGVATGIENNVLIRFPGLLDGIVVFVPGHFLIVLMLLFRFLVENFEGLPVAVCNHVARILGISVEGGEAPPFILDDMTQLFVQHVEKLCADPVRCFSLAGRGQFDGRGEMGIGRRIRIIEYFGRQLSGGRSSIVTSRSDQNGKSRKQKPCNFHCGQVRISFKNQKYKKIRYFIYICKNTR